MGNYTSLVDFFNYTATNFPAKHYMLDIWDHGSGVFQSSHGSKHHHLQDISFDFNTNNAITTLQLGTAIREIRSIIGQPLDIYANDACLMQMVEVATQFQNPETHDSDVLFQFGSEQTIPGQGWPYDLFLANWTAAGPTATTAQIGAILTNAYIESYVSGEYAPMSQVTYSALDLSHIPDLISAVSAFGQQLLALSAADRTAVFNVLAQSQGFATPTYLDVLDFLALAAAVNVASSSSAAYQASIKQLQSVVGQLVVASNASSDWNGRAHGVSMWLPQDRASFSQYQTNYTQLAFGKLTGFATVLDALLPKSVKEVATM